MRIFSTTSTKVSALFIIFQFVYMLTARNFFDATPIQQFMPSIILVSLAVGLVLLNSCVTILLTSLFGYQYDDRVVVNIVNGQSPQPDAVGQPQKIGFSVPPFKGDEDG